MGGTARYQVAIIEDAAAYRLGLESALAAARVSVAHPADARTWLAAETRRAALLSMHVPDHLDLLAELAAAGKVVALVRSQESAIAALRAGAVGVADWHDPPADIVEVATAALRGRVILPVTLVRQLTGALPRHDEPPELAPEEVSWLAALAGGSTVTRLADEVGYSERAMFRRLADVYARLGAHNRTEAMLAADRLGLLEPQR